MFGREPERLVVLAQLEEMMLEPNRILRMLADREIPLGMQCFTGHVALIEILGLTGFDFVMLDAEHSGADVRALEAVIAVAENAGLVPFVRVADAHAETDIRRAIEAGAMGIFLPMVKSPADVAAAARAAFFPPKGMRGICPATRAARYAFNGFDRYAQWNNNEVALVPMIEHPDAVERIDDICAMADVRMIVFGAGDLAYAMGEGTAMMASPKVQEAYRRTLEAARRHDVAVIGGPVLDPTPQTCRKALEDGVSIFCLGLDALAFRKTCEQTARALREAVDGTAFTRPPLPPSAFKS
ncbi:HpcH/HpaI aldolase family protein [Chelatococcus asaccharovorans]|nr:aldolase/citrate lyase family protein [Chelatococcus asaccharovorans]CAH1666226.1 2-dehydro-3-deoxyglucarate aldolase [Chelatococcus asaccharovorans]CAH1681580.1 2-dehydro-3-deoxyglucarate aldolase [Chelatococcus asaccharovorans]